ncbi:MAG: cysteine--tRNA ligase [Desulfobulbaceae bacterium]|nr:cysteine--tRNA ligase [Desulfobulbaceae bacterium]
MTVRIYNTLTREKSPFQPIDKKTVKFYVCGITAYDYCHIGHARSALVFDMIVKYLRFQGHNVTYVRNFTDIDDKIINRAHEQNTTSEELATRFIKAFHEDMESLGIDQPTVEPRATEHIPEIIDLIQILINKGLAYQAGNDVYYKVDKFKNYGCLSGRSLEDMQAGARVSINENKENPLDFALWKGSKPGEPTWDSPWGPGRPGWHIECSAMGRKLFGDTFDIHGGGKDLIFPHHENEIAQSEGASGLPFVNTWIHHGFVTIKDEKMSKSLGNFLTIRDVLAKYDAETLRYFVFSTHYRNPLDFSETAMKDAATGLDRLYNCLLGIDRLSRHGNDTAPSIITAETSEKILALADRFQQAMDNDFNTAQGLGQIFEVVKSLNRAKQLLPDDPSDTDIRTLKQVAATIRELAAVMGLLQEDPASYFDRKKSAGLTEQDISTETIEALIAERTEARNEKNWARADEIRDELLTKNIELKDGPEGTSWTVKASD